MPRDVFAVRPALPGDRCGACDRLVERVWLVPGDVDPSCAACFTEVMGREPVHAQGHSTVVAARARSVPPVFYRSGRRSA